MQPAPILAAAFVHPLLAASGLALGTVPVIIHLLNRRRFRRVVWAAMTFLLAANRKNARRVRIEQLLLLALRAGIMVLVAAAIARPFLQASPMAAAIGQASAHRILVIDDSLSMSMADGGGGTVFDRAREAARQLFARFGPTDGVSVVLTSRPARALIEHPSYDRAQVGKLLAELRPSQAAGDMGAALRLAATILKDSPAGPGARDVYVLTDCTRSGWQDDPTGRGALAAACATIHKTARLMIVDLGPARRDNVAVQKLRSATKVVGTELAATFLVDVINHTKVEQRVLRLQVMKDAEAVTAPAVPPIEPGHKQTVQFDLKFARPGEHHLTVGLPGGRDVLPADDRCYLAVGVLKHLPVLLVDGRPGIGVGTSATHYLRLALAPRPEGQDGSLVQPRLTTPTELNTESLDDVAVVILADVRDLSRRAWQRLEGFVRQGGGLVIFLGPQVNLASYNRLGFADGKGLLPVKLVRVVTASQTGPDPQQAVRLAPGPLDHPLLRDFREEGGEVLFLARIKGYVRATIPPARSDAQAILSYTTGDPAIVSGTFGPGLVELVTTSADMSWTNLPAKPVFPPLCLQLVLQAAPDRWLHRNVQVRTPLVEELSAQESSLPLKMVLPDGAEVPVSLQADSGRFLARYERPESAGLYRLKIADAQRWFSVNLPPDESNLQAIDADGLRQRLGIPFEYVKGVEELAAARVAAPTREVGLTLLWALLALILLETLLAQRFGHTGSAREVPA